MEYSRECKTLTGVDPDLVLRARAGEFVNDEKLKDHLFCFFKKLGVIDGAGKLQVTPLKERLSARVGTTRAELILDKCDAHVGGTTTKQNVFEFMKCFSNN